MGVGRDTDGVPLRVEKETPDFKPRLTKPGAEGRRHLLRQFACADVHLDSLDHTAIASLDVRKHRDRRWRDVVLDFPIFRFYVHVGICGRYARPNRETQPDNVKPLRLGFVFAFDEFIRWLLVRYGVDLQWILDAIARPVFEQLLTTYNAAPREASEDRSASALSPKNYPKFLEQRE